MRPYLVDIGVTRLSGSRCEGFPLSPQRQQSLRQPAGMRHAGQEGRRRPQNWQEAEGNIVTVVTCVVNDDGAVRRSP